MPKKGAHDDTSLADLLIRSADLRIAKIKAEKEAIEVMGKELSLEEKAAVQKRRYEILYQLELEGATIEREFVEKYRSKLARLSIRYPGLGIDVAAWCPGSCHVCISSCSECVACAHCITSCTNSIW